MHGLYLLWWVHERQIPPALVATILAAGDLAIVFLEIPTGRFADRFGHRASLIIGSLVQVAGMLCCWLGEGIPALIVASVLVGLGDTFRSGADQALLYRTCVALDREGDFQKIEARTKTVELVALVALTLAGGVIAQTWGFATAWLAEAMLCAVGLAIAWAMIEPPPQVEHEDGAVVEARAPIVSGAMALLILPASCLGAAAGAAAFLAQTSGISDPGTMTMLVAAITLLEAAGSAAATRLPATGARAQAIIAALGGLALAVGLALAPAFMFAVFALSFLVGLAWPLRAAAIQRLSADGVRAQAASTASACDMALSTITLPAAGIWRNRR
jgi:predicted MFS family arabinose efflux permease